MKTEQLKWSPQNKWSGAVQLADADLVMVFADAAYFQTEACFTELHTMYPQAHVVGCSSSGSVLDTQISDDDMAVTAVKLERGKVRLAIADVEAGADVGAVGEKLMAQLQGDSDLRHVFVLSDGLQVNGSVLAQGMNKAGVAVTGGLAGDGTRFGKTWVMADAPARSGRVAAIGFYGGVQIKSGCFAGWDEFGAERVVTRSAGNVVYEFDNQPALALYKKYLADQASELPASGLRFPLSVQVDKDDQPIIRTLLAIDEQEQSLTFAGDVPQGHLCKLMKTNLDKLIDNAGLAAESAKPERPDAAGLCVAVSCVGRRLVMGQLTEEELEIVRETLGDNTAITGFYSYGELAPFSNFMQCQLHNQTMTLTTIYE